jgi:hypothetical protein
MWGLVGLNPSLCKLVRLTASVLHPVVSSAGIHATVSVARMVNVRSMTRTPSPRTQKLKHPRARVLPTLINRLILERITLYIMYEGCLDELLLLAVAVGSHIPLAWCSQSPRLAIKFFSNRRCTAYISSLLRRRLRVLKPFYLFTLCLLFRRCQPIWVQARSPCNPALPLHGSFIDCSIPHRDNVRKLELRWFLGKCYNAFREHIP